MPQTIFAHSTEPLDFLPDYFRGVQSEHPIALEEADRLYHLALLGKTGVGKSTLLLNFMCDRHGGRPRLCSPRPARRFSRAAP